MDLIHATSSGNAHVLQAAETACDKGTVRLLGRVWMCRRRRAPPKDSRPQAKSSAELRALVEFKACLGEAGLQRVRQVLVPGETLDTCLLRFLKARDLRIEPAEELLMKDLDWRSEISVSALADREVQDIVGCEESIITENLPRWHQGFDRSGTPVIFKHYGVRQNEHGGVDEAHNG
eukprot:SRR837773.5573.p1 GENE.SRR837773.5573~~SRR837773.5573.p1  ORF type:complete len:177 (-),score=26.66 SRR837773.5573:523-1053(-)